MGVKRVSKSILCDTLICMEYFTIIIRFLQQNSSIWVVFTEKEAELSQNRPMSKCILCETLYEKRRRK